MAPTREADRLLQRLRTLVRESRRGVDADSIEPEARGREIERLKAELADAVKRTVPTEGVSHDRSHPF